MWNIGRQILNQTSLSHTFLFISFPSYFDLQAVFKINAKSRGVLCYLKFKSWAGFFCLALNEKHRTKTQTFTCLDESETGAKQNQ